MKKLLLFGLLCLPMAAEAQVIETFYTQDFKLDFLRNDMFRADYDYLTINAAAYSNGAFAMGAVSGASSKGWTIYYSEECAVAPSRYTKSGTTDNWLVTPAIELPDVDNLAFVWDARSLSTETPDGYRIMVSTTGQDKEDFTDEPLVTVDAEAGSWTTHYTSLDAYRGRTVYVAVHHNTEGLAILIDNIRAVQLEQMSDAITLENLTPQFVSDRNDQLVLEGRLTTEFGTVITDADIAVEYDGGNWEGKITSFTPSSAGKSVTFRQQVPVTVPSSGKLSYSYTVTVGDMVATCSGEVYNPGPSIYDRRIVIEERTGTWCVACPRGIVAMEEAKKRYSENCIGIAVHNNDVMTDEYYDMAISAYSNNGFPGAVINRVNQLPTVNTQTVFDGILNGLRDLPVAGVVVRADWSSTKSEINVNVYANFTFSANDGHFNVALVLLEQNVHQPNNNAYAQQNAYANGTLGAMGGYEKYGNPIPASAMYYHDVARGIFPDIDGEQAFGQFKANSPALYSSTIQLPKSVIEKDNIEVAALLIDPATGEILNAALVAAADFGNMDDPGLGVEDGTQVAKAAAYCADGNIIVDLSGLDGEVDVTVYGLGGQQLMHKTLQGGSLHDLGQLQGSGLCVVAVRGDDFFETYKLMY